VTNNKNGSATYWKTSERDKRAGKTLKKKDCEKIQKQYSKKRRKSLSR
jgi:hypothetical protein